MTASAIVDEWLRLGGAVPQERSGPLILNDRSLRLSRAFAGLADHQRTELEPLLRDWLLSDDAHQRFNAIAVVRDNDVASLVPTLVELRERLQRRSGPGPQHDLAKVDRAIRRLTTGEQEGSEPPPPPMARVAPSPISDGRIAIPVTRLSQLMQKHAHKQEAYGEASAGLAADLQAAGFRVNRLADLCRRSVGDRRALPILLKWLPIVEHAPLRSDIALVLGSRWARPDAALALIAEYRRMDGEDDDPAADSVRAAICTSLERVADDAVFHELLEITVDTRHGAQRAMAVVGLGNMSGHRQQAIDALLELLDDPDVAAFAIFGLVRLDAADEAARPVAFLTRHPNPFVRNAAGRAIRRWTAVDEGSPPVSRA